MMTLKNCVIIVLGVLMWIACPFAYAGQGAADVNLVVEGRAPIQDNDIARAREAAVKNAQEKAVLQMAEMILSEKISDEKFQALKSVLIGKAGQYVKNYRIASEGKEQEEYISMVNVVVAQKAVREELVQMGVLATSEKPQGQSVAIHLRGIKKYSDFIRLKTFLQSQNKIVKSVYPCALEARKATCELVIIGDVHNLIAELERERRYEVDVDIQNPTVDVINLRIKEDVP